MSVVKKLSMVINEVIFPPFFIKISPCMKDHGKSTLELCVNWALGG